MAKKLPNFTLPGSNIDNNETLLNGLGVGTMADNTYNQSFRIGGDNKLYDDSISNIIHNALTHNALTQNGPTIENAKRYGSDISVPKIPLIGLNNAYIPYMKDGKLMKNGKPLSMDEVNKLGETSPDAMVEFGKQGLSFNDNDVQNGTNDNGLFGYKDWGANEWGTALDGITGLGKLGLGIADYMTKKKVAGKQMALLDQQYLNNAQLMANRKQHNDAVQGAFAASAGLGTAPKQGIIS